MDLEYTLAEAGAVVAGLRRTLEDAMARANVGDFAVAVLDFSLGSETASPSRTGWSAGASHSFFAQGSRAAIRV